ncbi:MAG: peptide chain release factor N(5)-glutamine methyltransferase, partial [Flavobacteriales bacterium]|nr:peptide chain release factor N(5)-glutamine methyltransferase [Flavobacteriales bacterium]
NQVQHILMEEYFGLSRIELLTSPGKIVPSDALALFEQALAKVSRGIPLAYVLGKWQFYGLDLVVNPSVLIPRPETEELVQWILSENHCGKVLDIGTGSGCIPIALKKHAQELQVFACDISEEALNLARQNALANYVEVDFFRMDILTESFQKSVESYDVIVSNPPYIPSREQAQMDVSVLDHEPGLALFVPDEDPLLFYRTIADYGLHHLKAGGKLYVEIHESYGSETVALLKDRGYLNVELRQDINGKDRMVGAYQSDQIL